MANKEFYNRNKAMMEESMKNGMKHIPSKEELLQMKKDKVSLLGFPVPKEIVEKCDVSETVEFFKSLRHVGKHFRGGVLFSISGYDEDPRELYEIEEVVKFIRKLLIHVPFAFYYIYQDSWAFMKACIAKEIKLVSMSGKQMDIYEVSERLAKGLPITEYGLMLTVEAHVIDNIIRSIKIEGSKANDIKGAMSVATAFEKGFDRE